MVVHGDPAGDKEIFTVEPDEAGERLDAFLARRDARFSRSRLKALIKDGQVTAGGRTLSDPSRRINSGEEIALSVPPPEDPEPQPEAIPLTVVFEDRYLLVVDKPVGLVVHPAAGNWTGTLVNALLHHCGDSLSGIGGVKRPGIVHRLDKDTSGLMVVAKTDAAHQGLAAQFADHSIGGSLVREYQALVWGAPKPASGIIETLLDRDRGNREKRAVVRSGGRHAITHYRTAASFGPERVASLVVCELETGRTHQIRVHLTHIGHPLVGDPLYGRGFITKSGKLPPDLSEITRLFNRQALHAGVLGFRHPVTGEDLRFQTPLPPDMAALVERFRELTV
ncbi:ribosomal large subunit pseudouridine synthase D [Faunimonas pinastri]|uniref:Pseudouridine synthase n=1 Tax=Faunimonas pinastri TaxID=1855383 RepID=A0A1H8Z8Z9_9HYPH|nr:RluA family pseudouridine synthase [Faunimonas pinastri]SEP60939.1 ribosomal large subunit pseudouridine synthase D [Faunimonas pinastri]